MLIKKNSIELDIEQKSNVDTDSIFEDLKSIYSYSIGNEHIEKINSLKNNIESIKNEIEVKNTQLDRSKKIKLDYNKKIQDIELQVFTKREQLLNELGIT